MDTFNILDFQNSLSILSDKGSEIVADCPICFASGSLKVNKRSQKYDTYKCQCAKAIAKELTTPPDKPIRQKSSKEWIYQGRDNQPLIKVIRTDDGKGKRDFYQKHWNGKTWVNGYGSVKRESIPIYRHAEIQKAIAEGQTIFIVEGEGCADALWELGLVATCNIGGSGKWLDSHAKDLAGANVVICPDRDKKGVDHAEAIAKSLAGNKINWLYALPDSIYWKPQYLRENQGLDVADWIKYDGATKEMILAAIEQTPRNFVITKATQSANNVVNFPQPEKMNWDEIESRVIDWITEEIEGSELRKAIAKLAEESHRNTREIEELYRAKSKEYRQKEDISEQAKSFTDLLEHHQQKFNLFEVLPPELANILQTKAESDNLDPVRLFQNLLPATATMLGGRVAIIAKESADALDQWREYPIFYTADISPPSSGKSNASGAIWKPLKDMQHAECDRLEKAMEELRRIETEWNALGKEEKADLVGTESDPETYRKEHCNLKKFIFDVAQMEAVLRRLSEQKPGQGTVWLADELKGLFSGLDQYKSGGKGDSQQIILEAWNAPINKMVDRVDLKSSYRLTGQTLNICGGVQPEVAKTLWKSDTDPDGLLSRILPAMPQLPSDFATWKETQVRIYEPLKQLYEALATIPETAIAIPTEHKYLWKSKWEQLSEQYLQEIERNPAFAYFLGKQKSYVMRFALVLHCIDWAYGQATNLNVLSESALVRAIAVSDYYVSQFRLLQAQGESKGDVPLDGVLLKIWEKCRSSSTISTREVARMNLKVEGKQINASTALNLLQTLTESGYGQLEGKTLHFENVENVEKMSKGFRHTQTFTEQEFRQNVENVEAYPPLPSENTRTLTPYAEEKVLSVSTFEEKTPIDVRQVRQNAETFTGRDVEYVENSSTKVRQLRQSDFYVYCREMSRGGLDTILPAQKLGEFMDTFGDAQLKIWIAATQDESAVNGFSLWQERKAIA